MAGRVSRSSSKRNSASAVGATKPPARKDRSKQARKEPPRTPKLENEDDIADTKQGPVRSDHGDAEHNTQLHDKKPRKGTRSSARVEVATESGSSQDTLGSASFEADLHQDKNRAAIDNNTEDDTNSSNNKKRRKKDEVIDHSAKRTKGYSKRSRQDATSDHDTVQESKLSKSAVKEMAGRRSTRRATSKAPKSYREDDEDSADDESDFEVKHRSSNKPQSKRQGGKKKKAEPKDDDTKSTVEGSDLEEIDSPTVKTPFGASRRSVVRFDSKEGDGNDWRSTSAIDY